MRFIRIKKTGLVGDILRKAFSQNEQRKIKAQYVPYILISQVCIALSPLVSIFLSELGLPTIPVQLAIIGLLSIGAPIFYLGLERRLYLRVTNH
ncbi:MAG: hypothetical protein ABEI13_03940 [Candidatus Paceibacteria bacterium]